MQAGDEQLLRRFAQLAREVGEQELARLESRERLQPAIHRDVEGVRLGNQLYVAVIGSALVVSNSEKDLHGAIDLHLAGDAKSIVHSPQLAEARKLMPPDPAACFCLNMNPVQDQPRANI